MSEPVKKCGCEVTIKAPIVGVGFNVFEAEIEIVPCPKHAAVDEMVELLKDLLRLHLDGGTMDETDCNDLANELDDKTKALLGRIREQE